MYAAKHMYIQQKICPKFYGYMSKYAANLLATAKLDDNLPCRPGFVPKPLLK